MSNLLRRLKLVCVGVIPEELKGKSDAEIIAEAKAGIELEMKDEPGCGITHIEIINGMLNITAIGPIPPDMKGDTDSEIEEGARLGMEAELEGQPGNKLISAEIVYL